MDKNVMFFNAGGQTVYEYNAKDNLWSCLPDCPNWSSSFVVVNNTLAAIGGIKGGEYLNEVYSLKDGDSWVEEFQPMPTKCTSATSVCAESALIVIGGVVDGATRCPIKSWAQQLANGPPLPIFLQENKELRYALGIICGDQLYIQYY